ncbi:MAG: PTS sugar transporter subunit IIA [Roseiarcus sp.]
MSQYFDPRALCLRISARTAEEVIAQLADKLEEIGVVKPSYRAAAISREAAIPTGLPLAPDFAVAVPHTDREHVLRPGFALGTLTEAVPFRSMENPDEELPVRVVFALAITDKNEQIDMLQAVAELLQDPPTIRRIADAKSASEIFAAFAVEATASKG